MSGLHVPYILDSIPNGILVVDPAGEILYRNPAVSGLGDLADSIYRQVDWDQVISERKTILGQQVKIGEKLYVVHVAPISTSDGVVGGVLVIEDASVYSSLLQELEYYKTSTQDLQTIFDTAYDVIYVSDGNGVTLRVSSACERLWGMKKEELIGRTVFELEREGVFRPSVTRLVLEKGRKVQVLQETKTGRRLMVVGTPIRDATGRIIRVVNASRDITEIRELEEELQQLKSMVAGYRQQLARLQGNHSEGQLVYRSKIMGQIVALLDRVSLTDSTVLITGESGVGKEVIANYIHRMSPRSEKPFIKVNCAAIPENLLESELFGYDSGAFTGARKHGKAGLFELSHEGTLFLDEIGDMPLGLQAKLLRVLQDKEIVRLGGHKPIPVDVRIIAATNQDLAQLVEQGRFRQDLFYRLNVIPIAVPALRERREDILPLLYHFLQIYQKKLGRSITFSESALALLETYDWPGNVRELQNLVERLVVTADSEVVQPDQLPISMRNAFEFSEVHEPIAHAEEIQVRRIVPLKKAVRRVEAILIRMALEECGTISKAAERLGVDQSTLSRKIQKLSM